MQLLARLSLLPLFGIGIAAIVWASEVGPLFWGYASLDGIASRIIRLDNLPNEVLDGVLPALDALDRSDVCLPKAMHNAAIIRGRLLQLAIESSDPEQRGKAAAAADRSVRKSLSCSPADSFMWFALFWIEATQSGFRDELVGYLSKSYELGPYEGWIALRRNSYALLVYQLLPPQLQERVVREFAALVGSGFIRESAANLTGAGWPVHETLLAALADVPEKYRKQLATNLRRSGIEVSIPGVTLPELRPWQVD